MKLSPRAKELRDEVANKVKLGELRRIAKGVGTHHALALELWSVATMPTRQLAILIMDKKQFTQELVDQLDEDIQVHDPEQRVQLFDWLLANQLNKAKVGKELIASWENSTSLLQRRLFWYQQARLRWTGQTPPPNTEELLDKLETRMGDEVPEVQWAMNFAAGQIGTYEAEYRDRCIALGETTGLFRDEDVAPNCTPNYLPDFIRIQVAKLPT